MRKSRPSGSMDCDAGLDLVATTRLVTSGRTGDFPKRMDPEADATGTREETAPAGEPREAVTEKHVRRPAPVSSTRAA
jgi:hypothetical protein